MATLAPPGARYLGVEYPLASPATSNYSDYEELLDDSPVPSPRPNIRTRLQERPVLAPLNTSPASQTSEDSPPLGRGKISNQKPYKELRQRRSPTEQYGPRPSDLILRRSNGSSSESAYDSASEQTNSSRTSVSSTTPPPVPPRKDSLLHKLPRKPAPRPVGNMGNQISKPIQDIRRGDRTRQGQVNAVEKALPPISAEPAVLNVTVPPKRSALPPLPAPASMMKPKIGLPSNPKANRANSTAGNAGNRPIIPKSTTVPPEAWSPPNSQEIPKRPFPPREKEVEVNVTSIAPSYSHSQDRSRTSSNSLSSSTARIKSPDPQPGTGFNLLSSSTAHIKSPEPRPGTSSNLHSSPPARIKPPELRLGTGSDLLSSSAARINSPKPRPGPSSTSTLPALAAIKTTTPPTQPSTEEFDPMYFKPIKTPTRSILAPPLNVTHFRCFQSHCSMKASRNNFAPVPCMTCKVENSEIRWKCSWCCLRVCGSCKDGLDHTNGRDLASWLSAVREKEWAIDNRSAIDGF